MYQSTSSRQTPSIGQHPPYGLFLDPHRGRHTFTAVNPYLLVGVVTIIGGLSALVAMIAH